MDTGYDDAINTGLDDAVVGSITGAEVGAKEEDTTQGADRALEQDLQPMEDIQNAFEDAAADEIEPGATSESRKTTNTQTAEDKQAQRMKKRAIAASRAAAKAALKSQKSLNAETTDISRY